MEVGDASRSRTSALDLASPLLGPSPLLALLIGQWAELSLLFGMTDTISV